MPSRILRDGILDSRKLGRLSEGAQLLYYKLLSIVDDYGRYDADPELLIIRLFPWAQASYTAEEIQKRLNECAAGSDFLIRLYLFEGKPYLELRDDKRAPHSKKSKYPSPSESVGTPRTPADSERVRESPSESVGRVQPSPNTNTNTNTEEESPRETKPPSAIPFRKPEPAPPTDAEAEEFEAWVEKRLRKHPKKTERHLNQLALQKRFCRDPVARKLFEKNHDLWCATPEWKEKNGMYAPKLWQFVEDRGGDEPPLSAKPEDAKKYYGKHDMIAER